MNTATLERATITVARIIPAKDRGKSATIKDIDGRMFGIWPDKLGLVNEGAAYDIDYSETVKSGTTYRDIKAVRQVPMQQAERQAPVRTQASERKADPFVTSSEMREQRQGDPPKQNGNSNGQYYRPTAPRDAERMFVCSTLNAFIQTGRVENDADELVARVNILREVWQRTFGHDDR